MKTGERAWNRLRHILGRPTVALDYPGLRIVAHSEIERFIRAHSAKKEPETVQWIESLPEGAVLWDCGANIGAYSLIAASRHILVIALEPSPANFASLCENIQLNPPASIWPIAVALSDFTGINHMQFSNEQRGAAMHEMAEAGFPVFSMSGRQLIHCGVPQPDYLKIDTDGGELQVLAGLGPYLSSVKSILIEVDREEIPMYLQSRGFTEIRRHPIPHYPGLENRIYER